ncbi:hypothetical protein CR969_00275 [Candidatus Saccharibacteria bacterium]|nr:MAG: hypothetical protein CR969_00275 [Candidatus Saccharibacteria bacterium]
MTNEKLNPNKIAMTNKPTPKQVAAFKKHRNKVLATVFASILLIILVLDFVPVLGQRVFISTAHMYYKWIECGRKPVVTFRPYGGFDYYAEPKSLIHSSPTMSGSPDIFCTPLEAERAGYSASDVDLEIPHLEKEREKLNRSEIDAPKSKPNE